MKKQKVGTLGSGCGSVGTVVVSDIRGPCFETGYHLSFYDGRIYC